jgi:hypothetical protein
MNTERPDDADAIESDTDDEVEDGEDEVDEDDCDEDESDSLLFDEDEGAPNLVPEGHPQRVLAGRIEILEKIGEGGMGAVWRGLHLKLERVVAVKILDETLQLRPDGRERFIREARALALLVHRNVVTIYDCDELPDGKLYLCMELLAGETLRDIIKRRQPLDPLEVIDAGLQVCDAVKSAHDQRHPAPRPDAVEHHPPRRRREDDQGHGLGSLQAPRSFLRSSSAEVWRPTGAPGS